MKFDLLEIELASVEWHELDADGLPVDELPDVLRQLAVVDRESSAEDICSEVHQRIGDQVQQYATAPFVVHPLIAIFATSTFAPARRVAIEILSTVGNAFPPESKSRHFERAQLCRVRVKSGCAQYYQALNDEDPMIRDSVLWVINMYDDHRARVNEALRTVAENDEDERVRRAATRILTDAPFEFSWQTAEIEKRIAAEDQAV